MNLKMLSEPISTITCCLEGFFVVMLILSFTLSRLLMVLYISSIFFKEILEKLYLIFNIFLILENEACTYKCLSLLLELPIRLLSLFWKNFNFFRISLLGLGRIGDRTLEISAFLPILYISAFLSSLLLEFFGVNLDAMFYQNVLLWLSVFKEFHLAL